MLSADTFTDFVQRYCEADRTDDLLAQWKKLVAQAKVDQKAKYQEETVQMVREGELFDCSTKAEAFEKTKNFDVEYIRLLGESNGQLNMRTYRDQLQEGIETGMKQFPAQMSYPAGFVAVIYYMQYLTALLIDMNDLHEKREITNDDMWETQWLFFDDPNRWEDRDRLEAKKKAVLEACEEHARKMRKQSQ